MCCLEFICHKDNYNQGIVIKSLASRPFICFIACIGLQIFLSGLSAKSKGGLLLKGPFNSLGVHSKVTYISHVR